MEVDTDTDEGYQDEPNDEAEQGGGRSGEHGMNRDGSHRAGGRVPRRSQSSTASRRRTPDHDEQDDDNGAREADRGGRASRRSPERASKRESTRSGRAGRDRSSSAVGRGWEASRANRAKSGSFNNLDQLTIPIAPKSVTVAFLEEEPFATYNQHWVDEIQNGRKSFVCLGEEEDCPLCVIGLGTRNMDLYNVVDMSGDDPVLRYIEAGPDLGDRIYERSQEELTKPLNQPGQYFVIKKAKKNRAYAHDVGAVDENRLEKVSDLDPLEDEDIDHFLESLFDDSVVKRSTRRELQDVADELDD